MYFVDRQKIEETLQYYDRQLNLFSVVPTWETSLERTALERITHMLIESVLDVGNSIIDGFIMRDPGSYEDIIDILLDENVVHEELGNALKALIEFRKNIVQDYLHVDHDAIKQCLLTHKDDFIQFSQAVRDYLTNELGPVSAFKP
ncbi:uncharacterized protein YutE (UPF0331/DUF86 family) [Bacillus oleivorans]|uniref:Uncharacterized protein YutE (UPF0331/DUF86 family) n=1 Tax=Bacillus oleivorans TaxID=1448271 RepID=A0A285D6I7_9BACI|nr:DUF86 domain-containing protein [Bacillus oleivorans]SNX75265.1 uncharacterized protein YutE (UPF0331/DUF86 family) [Bacillus oleivorans]